MIVTFDDLKNVMQESHNKYDIAKIEKAYQMAKNAHSGVKRESGHDFISHPLAVAGILVELGMDTSSVIAAILHDTVEDTSVTFDEIKSNFDLEIAELVNGVTKLGKIPYSNKEEEQSENLRKMFLATAKDIRVIIIKLADRLHNMRTLEFLPEQKRRDKSLETVEIYAPLAHRLGMQTVKCELEDIAIRYLDPVGCAQIDALLQNKRPESDKTMQSILAKLRDRFNGENGPKVLIECRIKRFYSIYRKMFLQNKTMDEIYDFFAFRIIVNTVIECYNILGIIHDMFKPIPGRFKDYISTPKPNLYQSIHTTVIGREGVPFEVQIRTFEMHETAEYGIAAHWKYKRGLTKDKSETGQELVRKLIEIQDAASDPEEFLSIFKTDLFPDEVFVFTPKGDLINLPVGATVVDFAYAIHSAVGNRMIGAKINGKMVPLDHVVQNGDIVEILTTTTPRGPSRDWISIVKTSQARAKIKQWFKKEMREENLALGADMIEKELKSMNVTITDEVKSDILLKIAKRLGFASVEDLYISVGFGGVSLSKIIFRFKEEFTKASKPDSQDYVLQKEAPVNTKKTSSSGVIIEGIDNLLIKFSKCCNPLPGDPIIGFITKGFGISIHKRSCENVQKNLIAGIETDRYVNAHWAQKQPTKFLATLQITSKNRQGIVADMTVILANMKVKLNNVSFRESDKGYAVTYITIYVNDISHLSSIISKLEKVNGVSDVTRFGN